MGVIGGDSFLEMAVLGSIDVVVLGYEAEPYLRFSVTYTAEDEAAEDALMAETKARLETISPAF